MKQVGWANSSLRLPKDLPDASNVKGKGVVMETPLEDALHPSDRLPVKRDSAAGREGPASLPALAALACLAQTVEVRVTPMLTMDTAEQFLSGIEQERLNVTHRFSIVVRNAGGGSSSCAE